MEWTPNQDGILHFLNEVYPSIRAKVPGVTLQVVGRCPSPKILEACSRHAGVTVTGWVRDIREYLAGADVCIVPLRVGSGTRLKIFEAMAMGKAIVSTTLGAEGLPVADQQDILIADTPDDFAARTIELLQDGDKRERLGKAARNLVQGRYSWEAVTADFMQAISTAVNDKNERNSSVSVGA
jgi:glycosyltransferase involved in cell wall biosynthesis